MPLLGCQSRSEELCCRRPGAFCEGMQRHACAAQQLCHAPSQTAHDILFGGFLQIYTLPEGDFDSVATRFSLPVRALAYSPSGTNLAASGDDEGIKLISAAESKVLGFSLRSPSLQTFSFLT